jgi:hypothetical protein
MVCRIGIISGTTAPLIPEMEAWKLIAFVKSDIGPVGWLPIAQLSSHNAKQSKFTEKISFLVINEH